VTCPRIAAVLRGAPGRTNLIVSAPLPASGNTLAIVPTPSAFVSPERLPLKLTSGAGAVGAAADGAGRGNLKPAGGQPLHPSAT
jgi:hypothetical protein